MPAKQTNKVDFVECLNRRGGPRDRRPVSVAWLNDLIKDGLIDKFERLRNNGRSPVYTATLAHYRQAVRINRLETIGIRSRNALLLQLFVRGNSIPASLAREALRREFVRALRVLRPQMRSGYFANNNPVPRGHMASLSKQIGPLDSRLSNLAQTNSVYLDIARAALAPPSANAPNPFAGLLLSDPETEALSDEVEGALQASPAMFLAVRDQFRIIDRKIFRPIVGLDVLNTPEILAVALTIGLVMRSRGFSVRSLLNMIPQSEGFLQLVREFLNGANYGA